MTRFVSLRGRNYTQKIEVPVPIHLHGRDAHATVMMADFVLDHLREAGGRAVH
jgi:hypothetical protein